MNTEITDMVHESIARLTDGAQLPADLARRAARHNQQRRAALRTASATGLATVAAVATLVATAPSNGIPRHGGSLPPALTTAYVANQTERALTAAAHGGAIERVAAGGPDQSMAPGYMYSRGRSAYGKGIPGPPIGGGRTVNWWYRGRQRMEGLTAGGRLEYDTGTTAATGSAAHRQAGYFTLVDYPARTWMRNLGGAPSGAGQRPSCWNPIDPQSSVGVPPGEWIAMVRKALSCRELKLDGRQWIDGVHAIKIIAEPRLEKVLKDFARFHGTLWVDPATYLPIMVRWTWPNGALDGSFQWLPPTRANLRALNVTIPHGFRPVSLPRGSQLMFVAGMSNAPPRGR